MNSKKNTHTYKSYYDSLYEKEDQEHKDLFIKSGKQKHSQWIITWSDLMMTMFIVFLVMYLYQLADNRELKERRFSKLEDIIPDYKNDNEGNFSNPEVQEKGDISFTMTSDSKSDIKSVDLVSDRIVRIVLPGDVFFDSGTTDLKVNTRDSLKKAADIIKQTPYMVNVVGHTDNQPIVSDQYKSNWELSVIRACAVARFLIDEMNIPEKRIYVTGHSSNLPVQPNSTTKNMTENRRVEIIITKELPRKKSWKSGAFDLDIGMNTNPQSRN